MRLKLDRVDRKLKLSWRPFPFLLYARRGVSEKTARARTRVCVHLGRPLPLSIFRAYLAGRRADRIPKPNHPIDLPFSLWHTFNGTIYACALADARRAVLRRWQDSAVSKQSATVCAMFACILNTLDYHHNIVSHNNNQSYVTYRYSLLSRVASY